MKDGMNGTTISMYIRTVAIADSIAVTAMYLVRFCVFVITRGFIVEPADESAIKKAPFRVLYTLQEVQV